MPVSTVGISVADSVALALPVPPLEPGQIFPVPELPGGLSPASGVMLMLMLLGAAIQSSLGPPISKSKEKLAQERADDAKRVVKMSDVNDQIEKIITYDAVGPIFIRTLIAHLTAHASKKAPWTDIADLHDFAVELDQRVMGPLREKLKSEIRKFILRQTNPRYKMLKNVNTRQPGSGYRVPPGYHWPDPLEYRPDPLGPENPLTPFDPTLDIPT